jgi:hypothetical protein
LAVELLPWKFDNPEAEYPIIIIFDHDAENIGFL